MKSCLNIVCAKSPLGCSASIEFLYSLASLKKAKSSSLFFISISSPAYVRKALACPIRSREIFVSAISSSIIGPCPHHSHSRCPTIRLVSPILREYYEISLFNDFSILNYSLFENSSRSFIKIRIPVYFIIGRIEK